MISPNLNTPPRTVSDLDGQTQYVKTHRNDRRGHHSTDLSLIPWPNARATHVAHQRTKPNTSTENNSDVDLSALITKGHGLLVSSLSTVLISGVGFHDHCQSHYFLVLGSFYACPTLISGCVVPLKTLIKFHQKSIDAPVLFSIGLLENKRQKRCGPACKQTEPVPARPTKYHSLQECLQNITESKPTTPKSRLTVISLTSGIIFGAPRSNHIIGTSHSNFDETCKQTTPAPCPGICFAPFWLCCLPLVIWEVVLSFLHPFVWWYCLLPLTFGCGATGSAQLDEAIKLNYRLCK